MSVFAEGFLRPVDCTSGCLGVFADNTPFAYTCQNKFILSSRCIPRRGRLEPNKPNVLPRKSKFGTFADANVPEPLLQVNL
jgi:hypothetical protein